ncbi:MAG: succinylglutamate desuccinylase/aspartoacylase family protein [Pseudomonadota bacterium]
MTSHAWIRDKVIVGAFSALVFCVLVGWLAGDPDYPSEPTQAMLAPAAAPPLEFDPLPTPEWDLPIVITPPPAAVTINIPEPQINTNRVQSALAEDSNSLYQTDHEAAPAVASTVAFEAEPEPVGAPSNTSDQVDTIKSATRPSDNPHFSLLNVEVAAGELVRTNWTAGEALHGAQIPTPVLVAHGVKPGPTLCVTAAVHGDELNGIEAVRRLMYSIKPAKLSGTVIGVPIVNLQGFQRHSRYLSDRRDLNRFFPGNPRGSSASRMAHSFFHQIISHCDGLVDLHTGSFHRTNLPQLRADLQNADVLALTKGFGSTVILHSSGGAGTLRRAAVESGIPAVTLEAGEPLRLQEDAVEHTVKALFTLMDTMHMYNKRSLWGNPEPTYYSSAWVRADQGGILLSTVKLGRKVKEGDVLGTVTDPISNEQVDIQAPYAGRVIGMALNQFVMPGYATFHIATTAELQDLPQDEYLHTEGLEVAVSDPLSSDASEE